MAAGIFERIRKFLAMESDELDLDSADSIEIQSLAEGARTYKDEVVRNSASVIGRHARPPAGRKQEIVVFQPGTFSDAQQAAEHIKARKTVIINMKKTDKELGKRIIDFLSGISYAVDGNVQKIADNIFLFAPAHIDINMITETETTATEEPLFGKQ